MRLGGTPPLRLGVEHPALDPVAVNTAARRLDPGAGRRNYSDKGTPTLTAMVTGRRVSR